MEKKNQNFEAELRGVSGPFEGKVFSFHEYQRFVIGRTKKSYISLSDDPRVSRSHCVLEIMPSGEAYLQDLESKNGTLVGKSLKSLEKIEEIALQNNDYIKIGKSVFQIKLPEPKIQKKKACQKCGASISVSNTLGLCMKCNQAEDISLQKIGPFDLKKKLGEGGMGVVYLVVHSKTQYPYAIKIMHPILEATSTQIQRFLREASLGVSLKHPNLVHTYEPGYTEAGFFYIPMEYVKGCNLNTYFSKLQRPLNLIEITKILDQLLDALACLHENKIVHRDIKPANILVVEPLQNLVLKLADFGLAKNFEQSGLSGLTLSNRILGTPDFMAPEQCINVRDVDNRADIYSLGATIYYLLTRQNIYSRGRGHIIDKILNENPPSLVEVRPDIPKAWSDLVMKCMQKEPKDRFQDVYELKDALAKIISTISQ